MDYVIVGLGNHGTDYEGTRHNVGRSVLLSFASQKNFSPWRLDDRCEACVSDGEIGDKKIRLVLPQTFMNNSGRAVLKVLAEANESAELIVVHDELDLPLGALKISRDRGSGGHHGIDSIIAETKTRAFTRVRVGIAPLFDGVIRKPKGEDVVHSFLMKPFTPDEQRECEKIFKQVGEALGLLIMKGAASAMNAIN